MKSASIVWNPVRDLQSVRMADRRHARRVEAVAKRAMAAPAASFPQMMRDDGELEGAYRFFSNPNVSPDSILGAHYAATGRRVRASESPTVVVHDTTDCHFGGEGPREGVGRIANKGKGLMVHVALALAPDGAPHGLLDVATHTRMAPAVDRRLRKNKPHADRESTRWSKTVERAMSHVGPGCSQVVHVMDREADNYLLWEALLSGGRAFVIRLTQNRRLVDPEYAYLSDAIDEIAALVTRDVHASRRSDFNRHVAAKLKHPARPERIATLAIGSKTVRIARSRYNGRNAKAPHLTLNVVRVWEPEPPEGQDPVEWLLLTSLPVQSPAQLEVVVDIYRLRWTIEEFFKALKTGCAFERRQLESRHALENALAILAPIACRLLLLRSIARRKDQTPATDVLSETEIDVLRVLSRRHRLPRVPSARDALLAVAGIGGFLKRNGEPGWLTIGRGFDELVRADRLWRTAKSTTRCDQS